jgi:septal ring factor EnvC (AmiA/AmiB activator)
LEAAFLKGTIDETELLLKESVDREMTLEDKLKDQTSQLEKLEAELHSLEERQRKRYADVMKEKEDC